MKNVPAELPSVINTIFFGFAYTKREQVNTEKLVWVWQFNSGDRVCIAKCTIRAVFAINLSEL